jgi:hypothetical protein
MWEVSILISLPFLNQNELPDGIKVANFSMLRSNN